MTRSSAPLGAAALVVLAVVAAAGACGAPAATTPCLGEAAQVVGISSQRLLNVSHEAEGGTELARFVFDPAAQGDVTVTVDPAVGPFFEFSTGQPIGVQGHQLWSVRIVGLVGGTATDRVRSQLEERWQIREIVQVLDDGAFRWIVGTAAGSCVRFGVNESAALIVLHVSTDG